ncbi:MFS transporter, partial [Bacillus toyonensis]
TSATLVLFVSFLLHRNLPTLDQKRMTTMPYQKLIRSVLLLFVEERLLRIRGILALLIFTSFSILWTSLVLPL